MKPFHCPIEELEPRIAPATIYALTSNNTLLVFDSASPNTIDETITITGIPGAESIRGIDFRPASSELIASTVTAGSASNSVLFTYRIDTETGAATLLGQTAAALAGAGDLPTGYDFNPSADRIRYVNTNDENVRLNPSNGGLASNDSDLTPAATTTVIAAAYDRNYANAFSTTLYVIDQADSQLAIQGGIEGNPTPNGGVITDLAPLGFTLSASNDGGFDIAPVSGTGFAALTDSADNLTRLYTISLVNAVTATPVATAVGLIGDGMMEIRSITVAPPQSIDLVNATTATYTDTEGDRVTVKVSKGTLELEDFQMGWSANGGLELRQLNFSDDGAEFEGANIAVTAARAGNAGDGQAHVGYINATGVNLGSVKIAGDLGQIDAGSGSSARRAIASLTVSSIGALDGTNVNVTGTQAVLTSDINGDVGTLVVKRDVREATLTVTGDIASIAIGGSVLADATSTLADNGAIIASGDIGPVKIGGSIVGGLGVRSGAIDAAGSLASVKIGGSIIGGGASSSGLVESGLNMGPVSIGGSVIGGTSDHTGNVHSASSIVSVTIRGSIVGGVVGAPGVLDSGLVYAFDPTPQTNNIGPVKIGGSLVGGNGQFSGGLFATDAIASVKVGGSLFGNTGEDSGNIQAFDLGTVSVASDVIGGAGVRSGSILTFPGSMGNVSVGGSVLNTGSQLTGILSGGTIGAVKIGAELRGTGSAAVYILALGNVSPATSADAIAIKSITIGRGGVTNALVLAGFNTLGVLSNPDAQIGPVTVTGDWIASSISASVGAGADLKFGTADDNTLADPADTVVSRIASITIKGSVSGYFIPPPAAPDHHGFVAQEIASLKIGARKISLTAGAGNDDLTATNPGFILSSSGDVRVHEVAV